MLTPPEVDEFFATLRQLTADDKGLIFISHKLHEVMEISDDITVLRDGKVSGRTVPADSTRESLLADGRSSGVPAAQRSGAGAR